MRTWVEVALGLTKKCLLAWIKVMCNVFPNPVHCGLCMRVALARHAAFATGKNTEQITPAVNPRTYLVLHNRIALSVESLPGSSSGDCVGALEA
jgi:hypothetical protein